MRDSCRDLMDAFIRCISVDDEFASDVATIADCCEQDGNHVVAAAMRSISRNHRIRTIEGKAQIAALLGQDAENCLVEALLTLMERHH